MHISGAAQRLTQTHANYTGWATKRAEQQAAYAKVCAARAAEAEKLQTYADHGFKVGENSSTTGGCKWFMHVVTVSLVVSSSTHPDGIQTTTSLI